MNREVALLGITESEDAAASNSIDDSTSRAAANAQPASTIVEQSTGDNCSNSVEDHGVNKNKLFTESMECDEAAAAERSKNLLVKTVTCTTVDSGNKFVEAPTSDNNKNYSAESTNNNKTTKTTSSQLVTQASCYVQCFIFCRW